MPVKFQEALKTGGKLIGEQIKEYSDKIEKGWINKDDGRQFEITFTLKFKEVEGGDIRTRSDISGSIDKIKDTAEEIVTDQTKLPGTE